MVNGNSSNREKVTPISFFCAVLVRGLLEPIVILSHFCGMHAPSYSSEEFFGGRELLKNPTYQLVAQRPLEEIACLDHALPSKTPLFIIIDGISDYETGQLTRKTKSVMSGSKAKG